VFTDAAADAGVAGRGEIGRPPQATSEDVASRVTAPAAAR
jgi:hypothetical protein